jgi:glycosyltransferase involved in cell wall biosynthesis
MISRCVRSFAAQGYPADLFRLVVIADNCDDETSTLAASAGAEVMVRDEPGSRGKGQAIRWAMDRILVAPSAPDAIVVVDADAMVECHFLAELEAALQSGSQVVQADDLVLPASKSLRSVLEAAALLLRNRVRFAGRAVLGLPASLCGNGMLISRTVLEKHPWNAFTGTEDAEYAIGLRLARVRTAFAQNARVLAAPTGGEIGAYTQGLRWEAGRFILVRRWIWPILRAVLFDRRFDLLDLLVDLAVMPLGLLSAAAVLGTVGAVALLGVQAISTWAVVPWICATIALPTYVVLGLRGARAPSSFYRALLLAPLFMIRKLRIYAGLLHGSGDRWTRTQRPAEARPARS